MRIGLIRSLLAGNARWHAEHWQGGRSICGYYPSHVWAEGERIHDDQSERRVGDESEVTCGHCLYFKQYRPQLWNDAWVQVRYGKVRIRG
jgi:hypothetical protein